MARKKLNIQEMDVIVGKAEQKLNNDQIIMSMTKEYHRLCKVCDEAYAKVEEIGVTYVEGAANRNIDIIKVNPATKIYLDATNKLTTLCRNLKEVLSTQEMDNDDWLQ